jgi:prefoldin beta subunit
MDEKARQKIQDLQILEQNLQSLLMQKQNNSLELSETSNALSEISKTKDSVYKMVGSIIISVDRTKTISELEEKKKLLELRNSSIEKQEKSIESRAIELQTEIKNILEKKSPSEKK